MTVSPSRIEQIPLVSDALRENPLGDPHERVLTVYLPSGHDDTPDGRFPSLYLLASHGHTGPGLLNWRPWEGNIKDQLDALMADGTIGPMIVVLPDMWTRFGSSQYINSAGMGHYEDYLIHEIVPVVDHHYRTLADCAHRGILGRSSGGYGALVQAMHHPDVFGAAACHSGDLYWEFVCIPGLSKMHQQLARYGGLSNFIRSVPDIRPKSGTFWELVTTVCCAAAYGSNPDAPHGFDLPIDPDTGALDQAVWERWLAHDPIRKVEQPAFATALKQLKLLFIDVGEFDEYQLQVGARLLSRKLSALGIKHVYEEYPDGHRGTHYRYAESLRHLYTALHPAPST